MIRRPGNCALLAPPRYTSVYNKNQKCNAFLSAVWAKDSKAFLAHRSPTLPAHEPCLVSMQWAANLAAFSCRQWFMDLRRLSLMSIHEMLAYCRWSWREATSCCFGHSKIFHLIFKNENSCTDLCIWKPLEMVAGMGVSRGGKTGICPPWKLGLRTKIFLKTYSEHLIQINWLTSCNDGLFTDISGVGRRGCKRTPKSFDVVEIRAKFPKIGKIRRNLWKPWQNPWKSRQTP